MVENGVELPRRKRGRAALLALAALSLVGGVGTARLQSRLSGDGSTLSAREWRELRARWLGQAVQEPLPAPSPQAEVPQPESPVVANRPQRLPVSELPPEVREQQAEAYASALPKSVVELQPSRATTRMAVERENEVTGDAVLVNLNPSVNQWYLLLLHWSDGREGAYHLVNENPDSQDLALDPKNPWGLTLVDDLGQRECPLWSDEVDSLDAAAESRHPYVSLCGDDVTLRLRTPGRRTTLEWATDFLRDNVWGGEQITVFVRETLFQDAFLNTSETIVTDEPRAVGIGNERDRGPIPARLDPGLAEISVVADELGLTLPDSGGGRLPAGSWLPLRHHPNVFASVVSPNLLDPDLLASHRPPVSVLDPVESTALVYLVAFDLDAFELGFALGTEHPRFGWSPRTLDTVRDPSLPGPDGIDDMSPLVPTGIVPRAAAYRAVAAFTGGFKREHGAFRVSDLAHRNYGSHYGFVESGVILSKLQPGLATIFVHDDGRVEMKTWASEDDALLPEIAFARQNGLPILERDPSGGGSVPGADVSRWAAGNWSGSQDRSFRTVRAGTCLQSARDRRFLIYAYFSSATPSAMVRVFQAYGCEYAMMLDINALEHTYLAIYHQDEDRLVVEHLIRGMEVLDKTVGDQVLPRFVGFGDNRDFFYVTRRGTDLVDP